MLQLLLLQFTLFYNCLLPQFTQFPTLHNSHLPRRKVEANPCVVHLGFTLYSSRVYTILFVGLHYIALGFTRLYTQGCKPPSLFCTGQYTGPLLVVHFTVGLYKVYRTHSTVYIYIHIYSTVHCIHSKVPCIHSIHVLTSTRGPY